jgi:hypothetical protein
MIIVNANIDSVYFYKTTITARDNFITVYHLLSEEHLSNTRRLGRYDSPSANNISTNNKDNISNPRSDFNRLASLYKGNNRKPFLNWNKPFFGNKSSSLQKLLAKANRTSERATKFLNKIKSRQLACANRAKSIPENATIRKEYIKCGKEICELKHGPYYYAYWKDPESKKLKKKYIGDHMPKEKKSNDDSPSNQVL